MRSLFPKRSIAGTAITVSLATFSYIAAADDVIMYKDVPSAEEVNRALFGDGGDAFEGQRTRSIRIEEPTAEVVEEKTRAIRLIEPEEKLPASDVNNQAVAATEDIAIGAPSGVGLGFNLQFGFNSVEILPESKPYIDRLGEVMSSIENQSKSLLIMGHTDSTGSEAYNAVLSEKRASAVRSYLTTTWNIPADQLQIEGAGETQPLAGTAPSDGINRRVEFYAIN